MAPKLSYTRSCGALIKIWRSRLVAWRTLGRLEIEGDPHAPHPRADRRLVWRIRGPEPKVSRPGGAGPGGRLERCRAYPTASAGPGPVRLAERQTFAAASASTAGR